MLSISGKRYKICKKIGSGTFGNVYSVLRDDNKKFAFKKFKKDALDLDVGVLREISILKMFQGNNQGVMKLLDIIILEDTIGIIMKEYMCDLRKLIINNDLRKSIKKKIFFKVLQTMNFLHSNDIIHRDIKPENILIDENYNPVIADYSLSKMFDENCKKETHTSKIATSGYRSPEVVQKISYNFKADSWSVGVVFYELFMGSLLNFDKDTDTILFLNKQTKNLKNTPLSNIIKGLLLINPKSRWSAEKALKNKFFKFTPPKIENKEKSNIINVTKTILEICMNFEYKKQVTLLSAQLYFNKTKCSAQSAVELACKIHETDPYDYISEEYPEEEMNILIGMDYNLFLI